MVKEVNLIQLVNYHPLTPSLVRREKTTLNLMAVTLRLASDTIDEWAPKLRCDLSQSQCCRLETQYGEVKQRWVVIFSPEAYQRAQKTIDKQC